MNGSLLSTYFLDYGIKNTEDWKQLADTQSKKVFGAIRSVFEKFRQRTNPDEADTEDGLIIPVLEILGFRWSRQKSVSRYTREVPDFILFADEKSKQKFDNQASDQKQWDKGICILEAKRWGRALDKGDKTDPLDRTVPSNQILRYLSLAEPASDGKIIWGILTNGQIWRLYYHRALSRAEGFVEFNLSELVEGEVDKDKIEKFKTFYLLFRKEAFIPTSWRPKISFLDLALAEGKRWEEGIAKNLKEKIFFEVFPEIARGFLVNAQSKGLKVDEALLQEIYNNTLVLLYRLLFVLYAEDRNLFPIQNSGYKNYSLDRLRGKIAKKIDDKEVFSETISFFWAYLKGLFTIINNGDKNLGLPPYNGGLFDNEKYPFLEKFEVPDKFLVPAIDKLSRDYRENPPKRINYRDLSVRQLGSIYEGLLEFKLKIAQTDLGTKKTNGREIYQPVNGNKKIIIRKGELYLTNDKSERKSSGSYYTPDYIVQYIVKNTLEPFVQKALDNFEKAKKELESIKNKDELVKKLNQKNIRIDPKLYDERGKIIGKKNINTFKNEALKLHDPAEAILKLKILDPAMGSGHFLVGAVDYLADRILEILAEISDKQYFGKEIYQSPLLNKLNTIRSHILEKAENGNYIIDKEKLDDKNLIKRIILKRCLYGVDVNPLAVELSKVSLWLHTFTMGAPLSFLDHHLKCGNSLIGADIQDFKSVFERNPLFGSRYTGLMNAIEMIKKLQDITDTDISEVETSARLYESIIRELEPYKKLLDIYTADFYLRPKKKSEQKSYISPLNLVDGTRGNPLNIVSGKVQLNEEAENLINTTIKLAKNKRFFHWKLEFPEVWYENGNERSDPGFDVVIGNPPYLMEVREAKNIFRDLQLSPSIGKYYEDKMDIFYFFIEQGIDLLKNNGLLSYIVQEYWITRAKATKLRRKIFGQTQPVEFVLFKEFKIFKEAPGQHNMILILKKSKPDENDKVKIKILDVKKLKKLSETTPKEEFDNQEDKTENPLLARELNREISDVFLSFQKPVKLLYSSQTDKVYLLSTYQSEIIEKLKSNKANKTFNLTTDEVQIGADIHQPFHRQTQEGIFVLSQSEFDKYNWTEDEKTLIKPFYYAEQIDIYFYPPIKNNYYLIYTPIEACIRLEIYYLSQKIKQLNNQELKTFMEEFTPHLLKKSWKGLDIPPQLATVLDYINKEKENLNAEKLSELLAKVKTGSYPNIVKHLLQYKDHITSDHKPFGIHRARQKQWFEDTQKIIGVRKTKYPKFVVIDEPFYMDQSVLIIRPIEHKQYSPHYLNALLNSKFAHWWFFNQKRQGNQLQIDKEVLLNFPFPEIDFKEKNQKALEELKNLYEKNYYPEIVQKIESYPSNSAVLHDLLSFLARKIIEINQNKYLVWLFTQGKIEHGSPEMLKIIALLEGHPQWKDNSSEDYKKELAMALINTYEKQIELTENLINSIVYRLYNLTDKDRETIEKDFK